MKLQNALKKLERAGYELTKEYGATPKFNQEQWTAWLPNSGKIQVSANGEGEVTGITVDDRHYPTSIKQALEMSQIIGNYGSLSNYRKLMGRW